MPRFRPDSTITFNTEVRNNGVLTDAPELMFKWKMGYHGTETTVTPTHDGTGLYSVEITPETSGNLYANWDTDGALDVADEIVINIAESAFV
jgi:hypothetical protein